MHRFIFCHRIVQCTVTILFWSQALALIEFPTPGHPISASGIYNPTLSFPPNGEANIPMEDLAKTNPEFAPDQVHLTLWSESSMLVSWCTGYGNVTTLNGTGAPYDPMTVSSVVRYGLTETLGDTAVGGQDGVQGRSTVYTYEYPADAGALDGQGTVYSSPIIHHVVLDNLNPGSTYFYSVGSEEYGFSDIFNFTVPQNKYPFRMGVIADVGQTYNSSDTLERTLGDAPDIVLLVGDLAYADDWYPNGTYGWINGMPPLETGGQFKSYQPLWDTFGRLLQPLASHIPVMTISADHEIESQISRDNVSFLSYNSRYPLPRDTSVINIDPIYADQYWQQDLLPETSMFSANADEVVTSNSYYSIVLGPSKVIFLNNYVPYGTKSQQYTWLAAELEAVDREKTPWLIVAFHAPWYSTYVDHYRENAEMQKYIEPILYKYKVDVVLNGHVHAYDRSPPVYKFQPDTCGPVYVELGDGGGIEGVSWQYVDTPPMPDYCSDPSKLTLPYYQPSYTGTAYIDPNVPLCYTSQAPWSDYRDPAFGHVLLTLINDTTAQIQWARNLEDPGIWNDDIIVQKNPTEECNEKVVMGTEPAANADAKPYESNTPDSTTESSTSSIFMAFSIFVVLVAHGVGPCVQW